MLFLAMEYLRGTTLSHMAAQLQQRGERMPPDLLASLVSQACAGLHAAQHPARSLGPAAQRRAPRRLAIEPDGDFRGPGQGHRLRCRSRRSPPGAQRRRPAGQAGLYVAGADPGTAASTGARMSSRSVWCSTSCVAADHCFSATTWSRRSTPSSAAISRPLRSASVRRPRRS